MVVGWTIGHWEVILILVLALILFGRRLPEVARSLGKSLTSFKKGLREVEDEVKDSVTELRESRKELESKIQDSIDVPRKLEQREADKKPLNDV